MNVQKDQFVRQQVYQFFRNHSLQVVTLIFLSIDGHLLMIDYVIKSFSFQPLGNTSMGSQTLWHFIMFSGWLFKGAIFLALPAIVSLLVVSLSFGIMMKAAPQINIFSVGFPITLMLGVIIIYVSLNSAIPNTRMLFKEALFVISRILQ